MVNRICYDFILRVRLGALHGVDSQRESLLDCQTVFSEWSDSLLILWSDSLKWTKRLSAKKVASPNSVKWFSIVILSLYAKESNRIIFNLRITSPENQGAQLENQGAQLYQTDPKTNLTSGVFILKKC
jgi:hypothetical protein